MITFTQSKAMGPTGRCMDCVRAIRGSNRCEESLCRACSRPESGCLMNEHTRTIRKSPSFACRAPRLKLRLHPWVLTKNETKPTVRRCRDRYRRASSNRRVRLRKLDHEADEFIDDNG